MDFALTDEHRMVQQMVRDFAEKEVAPMAMTAHEKFKEFVKFSKTK
jgi:alkylation response protein AidB-like acyl-CoA dehydrogenase